MHRLIVLVIFLYVTGSWAFRILPVSKYIRSRSGSVVQSAKGKNKLDTTNKRDKIDDDSDILLSNSESSGPLFVPKENPFGAPGVEREAVLCGDPRIPPPFMKKESFVQLHWSRHGHTVARTTEERRARVFPQLFDEALIDKYRLPTSDLTYQGIMTKFITHQANMDEAIYFIRANIEQIPPTYLLNMMTIAKLNAQYANETAKMEVLKSLRERYIIVSDEMSFPAYIELIKAETRIQAYLTLISDLENIAKNWDEIELSMFFAGLLNARLHADYRVLVAVSEIDAELDTADESFAEYERKLLIQKELVQPALSAELFLNASRVVAQFLPNIYSKVAPELCIIHETYFVDDPVAIRNYIETTFCPKNEIPWDILYRRVCAFEGLLQGHLIYPRFHPLFRRMHRLRAIMANSVSTIERKIQEAGPLSVVGGIWGGSFELSVPEFAWYEKFRSAEVKFEAYRPKEYSPFLRLNAIMEVDQDNKIGSVIEDLLNKPQDVLHDGTGLPVPDSLPAGEWLHRDSMYTKPHPRTRSEQMIYYTMSYLRNAEARLNEARRGLNQTGSLDEYRQNQLLAIQIRDAQEYMRKVYPLVRKEAAIYGLDGYNITREEVFAAAKELDRQRQEDDVTALPGDDNAMRSKFKSFLSSWGSDDDDSDGEEEEEEEEDEEDDVNSSSVTEPEDLSEFQYMTEDGAVAMDEGGGTGEAQTIRAPPTISAIEEALERGENIIDQILQENEIELEKLRSASSQKKKSSKNTEADSAASSSKSTSSVEKSANQRR